MSITGKEFYFATKGLPRHEMIFVETGSHEGDTIEMALEFGFSEVRSVEITERWYNHCNERFDKEVASGKVKLYHGDSTNLLEKMIGKTKKRIVFWLDAHCSEGDTGGDDDQNPLVQEVKTIKKVASRNDHVIMIDDMRYIRDGRFKNNGETLTEMQLNNLVMSINSDYKFKYSDFATSVDHGSTRQISYRSTVDNRVLKLDETYFVFPDDVLYARTDW